MTEWKKICCAVDLLDGSDVVVERAASLSRRLGAELTLLHVFEAHAPSPELLLERYESAAPQLERAMQALQRQAERLVEAPVDSTTLADGGAAAAIVRFAHDGGFDLVVVGTHADRGLARLVLGSVASRVVREVACPALVVHQRPREAR